MIDPATFRFWGERVWNIPTQLVRQSSNGHSTRQLIMTPITKIAFLLAALSSFAQCDSPPSLPRITRVAYSGSACPQGSDSVSRDGDWGNLAFKFTRFRIGSGSSESCQVHIESNGASSGWQVSVSDIWVRGHAELQGGSSANFYSYGYWSEDADRTFTVEGRMANDRGDRIDVPATIHLTLPDDRDSWSRCIGGGGNPGILNINFRVALGSGQNSFEVNTENVNFKWRRC